MNPWCFENPPRRRTRRGRRQMVVLALAKVALVAAQMAIAETVTAPRT
jgi:hypothetical protein